MLRFLLKKKPDAAKAKVDEFNRQQQAFTPPLAFRNPLPTMPGKGGLISTAMIRGGGGLKGR